MSSAVRRALLAVLTLAALVVGAGATGTALAACPSGETCGGPGGNGTYTYTNTLTVNKTAGTVTSSPAGINCGTDCEDTDTQTVTCVDFECPDANPSEWDTMTLTASGGPSGYTPAWSGCNSVNVSRQCVVVMDQDRTVTLSWADTTAPNVSLTGPAAGATVGQSFTASASATDNSGSIDRVEFFVDGVLRATDFTPGYSASISTSTFAHGSEHTLGARTRDAAGNISTLVTRTFTVDHQVTLTLGSLPAFSNAATVPLGIGTDADATMTCRIAGDPPAPCTAPSWSGVSAASPDGSYTYQVVATDAVGNTASASRSFVLDRTAPAIGDFDGPTEGSVVGTDRVTFTFTASDANLQSVQCKVGSAAAGPCTSATSHEITGLTDGTVTFSLILTDKAGNQTTRTRTFQVQRPMTNTGSTGGGSTGGGTQTVQDTSGTSGSSSMQTGPVGGSLAALKRNPAKLSYRKRRRAGRTRLTGLRLTHVPRGARIAATCKGGTKKGCPRKRIKSLRKHGTVKLNALAKLKLRKGAKLTITVTAPGYKPKTMTIKA